MRALKIGDKVLFRWGLSPNVQKKGVIKDILTSLSPVSYVIDSEGYLPKCYVIKESQIEKVVQK